MRRRRFLIHSFAHLTNDLYTGFLAPLLPLLCSKHHLSLAAAGLLATVQTLAASLSQPAWSLFSDKRPSRYFILGGIFASGCFFSLIGLAPNAYVLALLIFIGGLGNASFHPLGTALASALTQRRKGLAIALFAGAGSAGYALGPLLISNLVSVLSLDYSFLAVFPALVIIVLWRLWGPRVEDHLTGLPGQPNSLGMVHALPYKAVALLSSVSLVRAFVTLAFINFLPFQLQKQGVGLGERSVYLFALQFGDAVGSLIGGILSDHIGRWRVIFWSPLLSLPFFYLFLAGVGILSLPVLFFAGMLLFASAPAVIVSAQKLLPQREGMAAALQIGFAFGVGGLLMGLVGLASEKFGVHDVLSVIAATPLLMSLSALLLLRFRAKFE